MTGEENSADTQNAAKAATEMLRQISAAVAQGNYREAGRLANFAIAGGMRHRIAFNARGLAFQAAGFHHEAVQDFRHALALAPNDPYILNAAGHSLIALGKFGEAIGVLDAAIMVNGEHAQSHYRKGLALTLNADYEAAKAAYEKALALDPQQADALGGLASIAVRSGDVELARGYVDRALSIAPDNFTANCVSAILEIRDKNFSEPEQRLRRLLERTDISGRSRAGIMSFLGEALGGQGRFDEAFAIYKMRNEALRKQLLPQFMNNRAVDAVRQMTAYFENGSSAHLWLDKSSSESGLYKPAQHVFLLGFMRSGTTLLEQVIATNPEVMALEEPPTLVQLSEKYLTSVAGLDALASLSGTELENARARYWEEVRKLGVDPTNRILVDKQPLNSVKLPLISKLFPDAKILFALRDPRDVVLSCYRRDFAVTATTFEFLSLPDAAEFYSAVMRLAEINRALLPLSVLEHRYEDMVVNFETSMRKVCDFIGIPWSDDMLRFDKAKSVADLRSPSAIQVTQPLFKQSVEQWRNYSRDIAPIARILEPWIQRFGYPLS